jgi:uncharacterized protein (TIGR00369 family)
MTIEDLGRFIEEIFPQAKDLYRIASLSDEALELRLPFRDDYLRPGGTISGPALMALADMSAYLMILSQIGPVALAVTTSLNINFMRKPDAEEVLATARLLKLGKRLAVADVHIQLVSTRALVAQATVTYSIPSGAG